MKHLSLIHHYPDSELLPAAPPMLFLIKDIRLRTMRDGLAD